MITYPLNNVEYGAEDAELFHCTRTSGVWAKDDFPFSVTGSDNSITVGTGVAWINNEEFSGKVVASKETTVLDLGVPDSVYPRIDVVAIQFDANTNETKLVVKKGTPASSPIIPAISRTASLYELYLCKIERPAGAPVVSALSVSDLRLDQQYCGLMADSVTSVNTEQINRQIDDFIERLRDTIEDVQSDAGLMLENYWTEDGKIPVSRGGTGQENLTEDSFVVGNGENSVKLLTPSEARQSMGLGNSRGVLAAQNGGTGHSSFNKGYFLVGSISEPIDSLSPAKARESMGLGNSTGVLAVPNGGTGHTSFNTNYFLRGNGASPLKESSPQQVLSDIGGQSKIHAATAIRTSNLVKNEKYINLSGSKFTSTNEDYFSINATSGLNGLVCKKPGNYLFCGMAQFRGLNDVTFKINLSIKPTTSDAFVTVGNSMYIGATFILSIVPFVYNISEKTVIFLYVDFPSSYYEDIIMENATLTAIYLGA